MPQSAVHMRGKRGRQPLGCTLTERDVNRTVRRRWEAQARADVRRIPVCTRAKVSSRARRCDRSAASEQPLSVEVVAWPPLGEEVAHRRMAALLELNGRLDRIGEQVQSVH